MRLNVRDVAAGKRRMQAQAIGHHIQNQAPPGQVAHGLVASVQRFSIGPHPEQLLHLIGLTSLLWCLAYRDDASRLLYLLRSRTEITTLKRHH